ncbi:unnamed protein product [Rangifer tarandus platyrhynchus]|uniref:Uncharacterized protein n=1 Tax=Rangifer tarandus platyrhynchus TaxID=3082113 RepID=A0AC59YZ44_RANTA
MKRLLFREASSAIAEPMFSERDPRGSGDGSELWVGPIPILGLTQRVMWPLPWAPRLYVSMGTGALSAPRAEGPSDEHRTRQPTISTTNTVAPGHGSRLL